MIYDFQDMGTKYYLTAMVRDWVKVEHNALLLLQNPRVKEITEADLSWNSDDDLVWTVMYLIGVGLLRYVVSNNGDRLNMALNIHWRKPGWLFDSECQKKLNNHINFLMEIEREGRISGQQPVCLVASLEMIKYGKKCMLAPREPVRSVEHERKIIARNRKILARKRAFHRGRRK